MNRSSKILIINPFGIGDVLFSTPLVKILREKYPNSYIAYICNRRVEPILINNPSLDEVFVFEKDEYRTLWKKSKFKCIGEFLKFLKIIKKRNFQVAIDLSLGRQYSFFLKTLKVPERIGFNYKNRGRFLTKKLDISGFEDKHVVEYYFDLLKFIGIEEGQKKLEIFLSEKDQEWVMNFLKNYKVSDKDLLIGIMPAGGESWGKDAYLKHWPADKFAELSDKIIDNLKAKILIFGSIKERNIAREVVSLTKNRLIDFCGRTSILEFAALLSKCKLLVANDGGPIHVASALGVSIVALFGPVDEKVYGPYPSGSNSVVIRSKDPSCRPCYKKFKLSPCLDYEKCMAKISVDEVFSAVKSLI